MNSHAAMDMLQPYLSTDHCARQVAVLSIVVPTFSEIDNIAEMVQRLERSLVGICWEVIFVDDDSPDGTAEKIRSLAAADPRVRCIQRIGRRGLSSACVEGLLSTSAPFVAVMDADLQHDEAVLPQMLAELQAGDLDIVVGSRYGEGGSVGGWDGRRVAISRLATRISHLVVPATLKDPMSGFFMLKRSVFMNCVRQLSTVGFKILVDLFASSPQPLRFKEVPVIFRVRHAGESKLDNQAAWAYIMLLLDKLVGHVVPVRFVAFAMTGGLGVVVHMTVLALLHKGSGLPFATGHAAATGLAMVCNFAVNNATTYRDRRLTGAAWVRGLLSFLAACSVGALANIGVASYLFSNLGGWVLAALTGIVVGAVWNYAVTSVYTWGKTARR
jgi:dolichol-phosphate mannosyltransferase